MQRRGTVADRGLGPHEQEAIRDFHEKIFLPDLLTAVEANDVDADVANDIARVFTEHAAFLK